MARKARKLQKEDISSDLRRLLTGYREASPAVRLAHLDLIEKRIESERNLISQETLEQAPIVVQECGPGLRAAKEPYEISEADSCVSLSIPSDRESE